MSFFRSLKHTAPKFDRSYPWPIDGLIYMIMFMGPMTAGLTGGMEASDVFNGFERSRHHDFGYAFLGAIFGIAITLLNGLLWDELVEPIIARFQKPFRKPMLDRLANVTALVWAMLVCAIAMIAPIILKIHLSGSLAPFLRVLRELL
jgi:predicted histidine transporter YuiF (NhaC family)